MSMQAINFALTLPIDESGPRLTLIIIAHHINYRTGDMFVGQDELAKEVRRDERTIRRYLDYLEERGFIARQQNRSSNGKRTTDRIELCGYVEWQNVLENGGTIPAPSTRGRQADNLPGRASASGQNTPSQPDKNASSSGHMVSGIKRTTYNQDNHFAGARARDAKAPHAPRANSGAPPRLILREDGTAFMRKLDLARKVMPDGFSKGVEADGAIVINADGTMARRPPLGSAAYDDLIKAREQPLGLSERSRAIIGDVA